MTREDIRYDRQLRLWGDEGQYCIEHASVCMLGSSSLACEILKSLVLAGVKRIHVVDSALVTNPDLGNNFFVELEDVGQPRAKVTVKHLKELNSAVEGDYDLISPEDLLLTNISSLSQFAVVVGSNLIEKTAVRVNEYLFCRNIPFVHVRVFGFFGYVRVSVQEHTVINSHEENTPPDLRLDVPFEALSDMSKSVDLDSMTYEMHSHTPYLLLYFKALEAWRQSVNDEAAFPDDYKKRKDFEKIYLSLRRAHPDTESLEEENFIEGRAAIVRCLRTTTIPPNVQKLLENPKARKPDGSHFWILTAALRKFVLDHGTLPVAGQLPDMTSDSARYTTLAALYREKAAADAAEVFKHACMISSDLGKSNDYIKLAECQTFCRNAAMIRILNGTTIEHESNSHLESIFDAVRNADLTPHPISGIIHIHPAIWYLLMRAVDRFHSEKSRYPGTNGVPCTIDSHDLKSRVVGIIMDCQAVDGEEILKKIPQDAIDEMCRYGCAEPHVVASLIGGIVAQEVIKLATHQYIPLDNTLIFDAHTQQGCSYRL